MAESYDLNQMVPNSFEHMANDIALRVLGPGHTGFGPGSDAGRDGFFEGEAPYPNESTHWSGTWYIQSKFHAPHLSRNPQKWLVDKVKEELDAFVDPSRRRVWPSNWIIVTNVDPSGHPETGAFDRARVLVSKSRRSLAKHFHIWGGRKVLDFLAQYPEIAERYGHFLTLGHVLTALYRQLHDAHAEVESIIRSFIVQQFVEQQFTKLEQAGSTADTRPGLHRLFTDLPFDCGEYEFSNMVTAYLNKAASQNHRLNDMLPETPEWRSWRRHPKRARAWFIKGGPGQGKSTITQYFCQIQRAALILERSGLRVTPEQRGLASEIQRAAKSADFWPIAPRIPISIELKEFAQWFGQRNSDQTHGVLTYLTEQIALSVEQVVQAGTLKRAFGIHSWVIVFDGLDEVPSSVKDAVASEVLHFVDDVLVECNADALTICTSRPQGYAGQFSTLDGPTLNLATLSPGEALACAKPIIQIDRSPGEAKKSVEILTAALESESVRELMTTPLQAHIMAVVVRDGGRPPERRWQLFNNFYQVIKRREATRNLPNLKLARLLREGDQLLKALHNRLGFVLHSRAETTKGAQTSLRREEFRDLVKHTVASMVDAEVDETVDILMEATTERLVLVSTPEHGQQVRFDIRPLQEFFAGEFLYESVKADQLTQRLEVIAGDSHWREVMHFVLSAFVENSRPTELSVAVAALERLNEGTGEVNERLVSRRMGAGALLALRLLQEGVLEQDKRLRQQFRGCLEPLFAFTDAAVISSLVAVNQPNSRPWLLDVLVECLREARPPQSIGAGMTLARILPDDHPRVTDVTRIMTSCSTEYKALVFHSLLPEPFGEAEVRVPHWIAQIAFDALLKEDWTSLKPLGLRAAIAIAGSDKGRLEQMVKNSGVSTNLSNLVPQLLATNSRHGPRQSRIISTKGYGFIQRMYFKSHVVSLFASLPPDVWSDLSRSTGLLQLVYRLFRFAQERTKAHLLDVLDSVGDDLGVLNELPQHLMQLLPLDRLWFAFASSQVKYLRDITDEKLSALLDERKVGECVAELRFSRVDRPTLDLWLKTVQEVPGFAAQIWPEDMWPRFAGSKRPEFLNEPEGIGPLIDKLIEVPELLLYCPESWGRLLRDCGGRRSELRAAIRRACVGAPLTNRFHASMHGFRLDLPDDGVMLPHLVSALMWDEEFFVRRASRPPRRWQFEMTGGRRTLQQVMTEFAPEPDSLEVLIKDDNADSRVRAAALIMHQLGSKEAKDYPEYRQLFASLYRPEIGSWYVRAAAVCLEEFIALRDLAALNILGELLDRARDDFEGRYNLDVVLEDWRQTSRAPVQGTPANLWD